MGSDGKLTEITDVFDSHIPDRMFKLEMENGEVIEASGNHLWYSESLQDKKEEKEYRRLIKAFLVNQDIPSKLEEDGHFPLVLLMKMFGDEIETQLLIEKLARSLGYSSYTPLISQEMEKDGTPNIIDEGIVYNYSYNDLIDFFESQKEAAINNNGYFYFGEVRTTEDIFKIMSLDGEINIPTQSEIQA